MRRDKLSISSAVIPQRISRAAAVGVARAFDSRLIVVTDPDASAGSERWPM